MANLPNPANAWPGSMGNQPPSQQNAWTSGAMNSQPPNQSQNSWTGGMRPWNPYYSSSDQQQTSQGPPPPGAFYHVPAEYYQAPQSGPYYGMAPFDDPTQSAPNRGIASANPANPQPSEGAFGWPSQGQYFAPPPAYDPLPQGSLYQTGSWPRAPQQNWYNENYYYGPYQQQQARWQQPWQPYWRPPGVQASPGQTQNGVPPQTPGVDRVSEPMSSEAKPQPTAQPSMIKPSTNQTVEGPSGPKILRISDANPNNSGDGSEKPGTSSTSTVTSLTGDSSSANAGASSSIDVAMANSQFTREQYEQLSQLYNQNQFPSVEARREFAEKIGLSFRQVSSWFTARRRKDKPHSEGHPELTTEQLNALQEVFNANPVPSVAQRQELATKLGLTFARVSVWFGSRRNRIPPSQEGVSAIIQNLTSGESKEAASALNSEGESSTSSFAHPAPINLPPPPPPPPSTQQTTPQATPSVPGQPDQPPADTFEDLTEVQVTALTDSYLEQKYPTIESRTELGEKIGLPTTRVTAWFVARRQKERPQTVRRRRPELTKEQLDALQNALKTNPVPTLAERQELANSLGLTFARVSSWFGAQRQPAPPNE